MIANTEADTSGYTALQKKAAELVGSAKNIAQFLDRDTRPDFASTVMIPAIQTFIKNPKDIDGLCNSIEGQEKSIFAQLRAATARAPPIVGPAARGVERRDGRYRA